MKTSLSVISLLLVFVMSAAGQTHRGLIRGHVTDSSGQAVAAAQVSATNQATNEQRRGTSDAEGTFTLAELPPGDYRLVIEAGGHKMHVEELTLEVSQERRTDVRLQLGALTERVEVVAPRADARRDTAMGTVIDNGLVVSLPLDGRNVLELTLLAPGAVPSPQGSAS
jgi:Carboxypeptidase regulatory-like domain